MCQAQWQITRFNNKDNLNIERLQPFGRIGFVTIRSRIKKNWTNEITQQLWLGYQNTTQATIIICTINKKNYHKQPEI